MSNVLIIGASGKIGKILVPSLASTEHTTVAMVRDQTKVTFPSSIKIIEADLEGDISNTMIGCDTVVFSAGSGSGTGLDKTFLVDLWGAKKAIDCAKETGVTHFIMVSSIGADDPNHGPQTIKPYVIAKHFADEHLMQSGLNYTILRPGLLTDDPATHLIRTSPPSNNREKFITRADVAGVIAFCLDNHATHNKIYDLYQGTSAIEDAIV